MFDRSSTIGEIALISYSRNATLLLLFMDRGCVFYSKLHFLKFESELTIRKQCVASEGCILEWQPRTGTGPSRL